MINFTENQKRKNAGFTLIEMLVAVFVFSIVMTIATGAIFSIVNANKKSQALKSVLDNLNSSLDTMSAAIRYGSNYHCGQTGDPNLPVSCPEGGRFIAFLNKDGVLTTYQFVDNKIQVRVDNGDFVDLTAPEINVKDLLFYVKGADGVSDISPTDDFVQPQVLITLSGFVQSGSNQSTFNVETMVTQRNPVCKKFMENEGVCINN